MTKRHPRLRLIIGIICIFLLAACGGIPSDAVPSNEITAKVFPTKDDAAVTLAAESVVTATSTNVTFEAVQVSTPGPINTPFTSIPATFTPIPTIATAPSASLTVTPDSSPTHAPFVADDGIDRRCPETSPAKPDYNHYYLGGSRWPQLRSDLPEHFWLTKPLPGGGRLLYTDWFPYGYDAGGRYLLHNGLDSAEPLGTPVLAVADGIVVTAGSDADVLYGWRCDWYGHLVVIQLDDLWQGMPVFALYGHVLNIGVEIGERVVRGQPLAEVGVGGAASVPHLHFEVRVGSNEFGSTRNPLLWIAPPASRGVIAGRLIDPEGRPWQGVPIRLIGDNGEDSDTVTWTYLDDPQHLINADERYGENFVAGDLRPGEYQLHVTLQGNSYQVNTEILGGQLSVVEIVTEPFVAPTPVQDQDD